MFYNFFNQIDARRQLYFQTDIDYDPQALAEMSFDSYKKFSNFIKYELPHFSRQYGGIDRYLRYYGCNQESPYTIEKIQEIISGSELMFGWDLPLGMRLNLGELNVDIFSVSVRNFECSSSILFFLKDFSIILRSCSFL